MSEMVLLCRGALADGDIDDDELARVIRALPRAGTREFDTAPGAAAWRRSTLLGHRRYDPAAGQVMATELADERWLRDRFELQPAESPAAFAAAVHDLTPPVWALAPVHLRLGRDHAVLTDPLELKLTEAEAEALARSAREVFEAEGMTLATPGVSQWYLHSPVALDLQASSRAAAAGRNVDAYLPRGDHARWWRKWLTEVQMGWHEHPVNLDRESRGLPAVNALWLDGAVRQAPRAAFGVIVSADPALLGLARASGVEARHAEIRSACDAIDAARQASSGHDRGCLVDCAAWLGPRLARDPEAWLGVWREFLSTPPAGAAPGDVHWVFTGDQGVTDVHASPADRWRFWRRQRLSSLWTGGR